MQLRIKDRDEAALRLEVAAARARCAARSATLVLNDHWRLAIEDGLSFVHLGQEDLDGADLPSIRARGIRIGVSTHSHAELDRALSLAPDYVALGPVYPTTLKQMPWAPQGLARLAEWRRLIGERPLVAIGGIDLERAPLCLAAGADSVAVVSAVVRDPDPEARVRAFLVATQ